MRPVQNGYAVVAICHPAASANRHHIESVALREVELPTAKTGFSAWLLATVRLSAKCCIMVVVLAVFAKLPPLANSKTSRVSLIRSVIRGRRSSVG